MLVHRRVTPSSMSPVPIYTPGWRETTWGKVSCLRKQHDGREWALNHQPPDLKSNALTTTPPRPHALKELEERDCSWANVCGVLSDLSGIGIKKSYKTFYGVVSNVG